MALGCGSKLAKMFLIVFNIIFFILGAVALALGIWVLVDKTHLITLTKSINTFDVPGLLESGAYVLIAGGAFIFVVGFLGCCGAMKEVKLFLILYAIFVIIIFCAELAAGIVAYFFRDQIVTQLKTYLNESIALKYEGVWGTSEPFSLAWDFAHVTFDCCGFNNGTDFTEATKWNRTMVVNGVTYAMTVPPSCCKIKDKSKYPSDVANIVLTDSMCPITPSTTNSNSETGCYQAVIDKVLEYSGIVMGVGIGIAAIEIIGIICACCLVRAINEDNNKLIGIIAACCLVSAINNQDKVTSV